MNDIDYVNQALGEQSECREALLSDRGRIWLLELERLLPGFDRTTEMWPLWSRALVDTPVFAWTHDTEELLLAGARSLPDSVGLHWTDVPTTTGFLYFPEPIVYDPGDAPLHAVSWAPVHLDLENGQPLAVHMPGTRFIPITGDQNQRLGVTFWHRYKGQRVLLPASIVVISLSGDRGESIGFREDGDESGLRYPELVFISAILFMNQELIERVAHSVPRAIRRRQVGIAVPEPQVVRLRRVHHSSTEVSSGTVDWQFRWAVRGHWRNQFVGASKPYKLVWVRPHWKGPEDKPVKPINPTNYFVGR